jgi:hypothetical protein
MAKSLTPDPTKPSKRAGQNDPPDSPFGKSTQENATKSNAIEIPQISLPKGGGALKGIDEKFQVNSANGTAAFSIPLPLTAGRNNFSPSLSLSYNSGMLICLRFNVKQTDNCHVTEMNWRKTFLCFPAPKI